MGGSNGYQGGARWVWGSAEAWRREDALELNPKGPIYINI